VDRKGKFSLDLCYDKESAKKKKKFF